MQTLKDSTDADGRRRLRTRSRRSRRLKGGAAGAAAEGSSGGQSTATWTSLGLSSGGDLERLPASTFSGVMIVWAVFVTWAILRSVWDQHKEEGLGNASLAHVRQSMSLAEAAAKLTMQHFHHASIKSGSEEHRKAQKSSEAAQKWLEQTRTAFKKKAQEEGHHVQEETRSSHEPVLVAPGDVAISKTSGEMSGPVSNWLRTTSPTAETSDLGRSEVSDSMGNTKGHADAPTRSVQAIDDGSPVPTRRRRTMQTMQSPKGRVKGKNQNFEEEMRGMMRELLALQMRPRSRSPTAHALGVLNTGSI